jgi:hypothetical protein
MLEIGSGKGRNEYNYEGKGRQVRGGVSLSVVRDRYIIFADLGNR